MEFRINTESGHGRVKIVKGGEAHSTGFVGGDVEHAAELGISGYVESFWTDDIKAKFAADKAEREAQAAEAKEAAEATILSRISKVLGLKG